MPQKILSLSEHSDEQCQDSLMTNIFNSLCFHKSGRPRKWLRTVLADSQGAIRLPFRHMVFKKNGNPRARFRRWMIQQDLARATDAHMSTLNAASLQNGVNSRLEMRWAALRPLRIFPAPSNVRRITLVTDSVASTSLMGGVGTALIMAAIWAERTGAVLRVVTRTEPPTGSALSSVLSANGLSFSGDIEYVYCPHFGSAELEVGTNDMFLATSWWTARCLLNTVPAQKIVYLLQEDERMFYPFGDDHLACSETLAEPFALVVINSGLLHSHLSEGANSIPQLSLRSVHFEPAFTYVRQTRVSKAPGAKKKLFFYARPHNPRNLYWTGIRLLNQAAIQGVIDSARWEIHLVGRGLERLQFENGLTAVFHDQMSWQNYAHFLQGVDAGLSLMYTPHPSYPPLDLAAMGIPVLTNRFGLKSDLSMYSNNILCSDLRMSELIEGLRRLMKLAEDPQASARNRQTDHINRDWGGALRPVIERLSQLEGCRG